MHTRAYAKTIAFNLAADYGWLITAPVPEGDIDGSGLDWFAELLVSKKERERMKIAAEKSAKSNVASFAHTEDKQQKYRIEDFNYNHNNKISDLIEWGLCIATSRAVSSSDREHVADAYFPPSKPASRMEDPSPEHVFMQQVEELIENECVAAKRAQRRCALLRRKQGSKGVGGGTSSASATKECPAAAEAGCTSG
jgi:hypothetical protein